MSSKSIETGMQTPMDAGPELRTALLEAGGELIPGSTAIYLPSRGIDNILNKALRALGYLPNRSCASDEAHYIVSNDRGEKIAWFSTAPPTR